MERERPKTPDQCKEYHKEMAAFHMACAHRMDFNLNVVTKWFGHSEQELLELKKFLVLKSTKQDIGDIPMMTPSVKIEQMWNNFLKFPSLYHKFCHDLVMMKFREDDSGYSEILQYNIIDHVPLCDPVHTNATFNVTLREYERFFDCSPPKEIWCNPFLSGSSQLIGKHSVASPEEMPCRSSVSQSASSIKRFGFLPEEENDDDIIEWSQKYNEDKKHGMVLTNENSNKNNDVEIKAIPRFGVKISSSSGGGKRERSNSVVRTRSNSVTSVSSSDEAIVHDKRIIKKKKKLVTKESSNKNPNNGRIVSEEHLYYCLENDTCSSICSSFTINGGVDELIRLNSPYNGVKVTKKTKFKAGTALRIDESVENPGAHQLK